MPTVIDELVVKLGFDTTGVKKGRAETSAELKKTRDEAATFAKQLSADGAKASEFFSAIKVQALSLLGVFLGGKGIESYIRDTTKSLADMGRAAVSIGISTQDLQAFTLAIERMGGSGSAAQSSLEGIAVALKQWQTYADNPDFLIFLNKIGATANMKPFEIMQKFSGFVHANENTPQGIQTIKQFGAMGGIDPSTIQSLIQMEATSSLTAELARSRELGDVASKEQIAESQALQTAIKSLEQAVDGLAKALLNQVSSPLTKAIDDFTQTIIDLRKLPEISKQQPPIPEPTSGPNAWANRNQGKGPLPSWWDWLWGEDMGEMRRRGGGNTPPQGVSTVPGATHAVDLTMSPAKRALLDTIAAGESSGPDPYNQRNGAGSSARGRYQFMPDTWSDVSKQTGLTEFSPANQDKNAWALAERQYRRYTFGRDLDADLQSGGHESDVVAALRGTWPSLPGGSQQNTTMNQFQRRLRDNAAPKPGPQTIDPAIGPHKMLRREDLQAPGPRMPPANNDNSTDININSLNIHSQADNPRAHAEAVRLALGDIAAQSDRGLA